MRWSALTQAVESFCSTQTERVGFELFQCLICNARTKPNRALAESHVRSAHADLLIGAVVALARSLNEPNFADTLLVSKLSFSDIRFPRSESADDGDSALVWGASSIARPVSDAAADVAGARSVRDCVVELDMMLFGLPNHVPRTGDAPPLTAEQVLARCTLVGDAFGELEGRRAAEEQRLKALAEEQRVKALEEQRAKAREEERLRKEQRQRADEQRARERELERTRKERERDERERRAAEQRLAKQRHDQLIHAACLQLRHSILASVTRDLCDGAALAAIEVARAEAVVEARTQLAVTTVAKRAQARIVENTLIDMIVETVSDAWREHQQDVIRQRLMQQQQAAQRDTTSAALAAAAAATAAALATGAKRPPSLLETTAALRTTTSTATTTTTTTTGTPAATAAPAATLGLALPPGLFSPSVLMTSPSPPPMVGVVPIASPPPSMVGVSIASPNQPSTFSSSAALKSPPQAPISPLELFAPSSLLAVLGVAPTPSPPPVLPATTTTPEQHQQQPPPPGINELPHSFGFDDATTVLVYNLSAMRATRTDVVHLLSGCSVAVNERFESQIRFVRNDVGGVCALVQLSSAADVKRAKERTGVLLDGRPVYVSQAWRRSPAKVPVGVPLYHSGGAPAPAPQAEESGGVNRLDLSGGGDWLASLLGPSGAMTSGAESSEESGRRGRLFARGGSGAVEQQR
jgi:hypothetical protein